MESLLGILVAFAATAAADTDGEAENQEPSNHTAGNDQCLIVHWKNETYQLWQHHQNIPEAAKEANITGCEVQNQMMLTMMMMMMMTIKMMMS